MKRIYTQLAATENGFMEASCHDDNLHLRTQGSAAIVICHRVLYVQNLRLNSH